MEFTFYLLIIIAGCLGLSRSANLTVNSVVKFAQRARISDFTLGFFILGLATTTPEFFIGLNSVIDQVPELSAGNLIGGIIILLSLIIGLAAVLTGRVTFHGSFTDKEMLLTGFLLISPSFLIVDRFISRNEGLLLLSFYLIFFLLMNRKETFLEHLRDEIFHKPLNSLKTGFQLILGIAGLLIFAKIVVETALALTGLLKIPHLIVGLLLLSIGTNLPELSLGFAARKHYKQLAIGNFLGSAAANIPVLGLLALVLPVNVNHQTNIGISALILVLVVTVFCYFAHTKHAISGKEGIVLLLIYGLFLASEILSATLF